MYGCVIRDENNPFGWSLDKLSITRQGCHCVLTGGFCIREARPALPHPHTYCKPCWISLVSFNYAFRITFISNLTSLYATTLHISQIVELNKQFCTDYKTAKIWSTRYLLSGSWTMWRTTIYSKRYIHVCRIILWPLTQSSSLEMHNIFIIRLITCRSTWLICINIYNIYDIILSERNNISMQLILFRGNKMLFRGNK